MIPTLTSVYPADEDSDIPVGETLVLVFDHAIDLVTAERYLALYGPDFDRTSGPNSAVWIKADGANPNFLRSPGFKGLAPYTLSGTYLDSDTLEAVDLTALDQSDEVDVVYQVTVTPSKHLAPDTEYTFHIIGDPDDTNKGISTRTVWDTLPDPGNSSSTGEVVAKGGYTGNDDSLIIDITTSGDLGVSKYRWYWESLGVSSAKTGVYTSIKYLYIDRGVELKFSGSGFVSGDTYTITCSEPEYLDESYKIVFTTNDGTYSEAPESPSTPATSEPPASTIPAIPGAASGSRIQIVSMTPYDGAYNVTTTTNQIIIEFDDDLDATSFDADDIVIEALPIDGVYQGIGRRRILAKTISVSGNILTINI